MVSGRDDGRRLQNWTVTDRTVTDRDDVRPDDIRKRDWPEGQSLCYAPKSRRLFGLALLGDGFLLALEFLRVCEIVILDEVEVVIELEDIRSGGRDVQTDDVGV